MSGRYALATIALDDMPGGLERNFISLANALARRGHTVSLITFDRQDARSFYSIDNDVRWYKVGVSRPHGSISFGDRLRLMRVIRAALRKPASPSSSAFITEFSYGSYWPLSLQVFDSSYRSATHPPYTIT